MLESTDLKGNAEVKNLAALRAEEAAKRDKTLKQIQDAIGTEPRVGKTTSVSASLVEPENSHFSPTAAGRSMAGRVGRLRHAFGIGDTGLYDFAD